MSQDDSNEHSLPKRIVFRIPSNTKLTAREILNAYGKFSGYGDLDPSLHYVHYQPRETSHFHVIVDINYTKVDSPNVTELPHEMYRVLLKEGVEPGFERLYGKPVDLMLRYTYIYRWGK